MPETQPRDHPDTPRPPLEVDTDTRTNGVLLRFVLDQYSDAPRPLLYTSTYVQASTHIPASISRHLDSDIHTHNRAPTCMHPEPSTHVPASVSEHPYPSTQTQTKHPHPSTHSQTSAPRSAYPLRTPKDPGPSFHARTSSASLSKYGTRIQVPLTRYPRPSIPS